MSRKVNTVSNTDTNAAYPDGGIRNESGPTLGSPLVEALYHDALQTWHKLMRLAGIPYNGLADNETNGYQLIDALKAYIQSIAATTTQIGTARIATAAEALTGVLNTVIITPLTLANETWAIYKPSASAAISKKIYRKVVEIGGLDLYTFYPTPVTKNVAHGIAENKIISINVIILNDAQNISYFLSDQLFAQGPARSGSGTFSFVTTVDSSTFSSTLVNRGFVVIEYIA